MYKPQKRSHPVIDAAYFDKELTHFEIKTVRETFESIGGKIIGRMLIFDHIQKIIPIEIFYHLPRVLRGKIIKYIFRSDIDLCAGWTLDMMQHKANPKIQTFYTFPRYYKIVTLDKSNDEVIQSIAKEIEFEEPEKRKKKSIPATTKRLVWNTYIGEEIGKAKCTCCQLTDITQMSFHCGHIVPEFHGGESRVSNLRPMCQNCNSSMGTKSMEEFMSTFL